MTTANNQTLGYDVVDRLTSATGIYTSESIQYDSSGNRKNFSGTGLTISSTNNWTTKFGGSTNITYTSTGNMTAFGSSPTMTYSKANRLATTTVTGPTTSTYTYDGFGQRTQAQVGAAAAFVQQYGQDGTLLMETSGGAETDYVYVDGIPVATIKPSTAVISALHTDNINTPQKATSSTQTLVWSGNYTPFGQVTPSPATIVQNLRRPGQYADATGLYHNGYRDQFPTGYGQYIESDPIGLAGGNISTYPYAFANPMKWTDRSGLCLEDFCVGEAIIATEAVEALSAGVADAAATLEAGGAANATGQAIAIGGVAALPEPAIAPEPPVTPGSQCIVAGNGTRITGFTEHGINRVIGDTGSRAGTRPDAILDALTNPRKVVSGIDSQARPFQIFTGQNARVVVNPTTGEVVSVNPLSGAGALK